MLTPYFLSFNHRWACFTSKIVLSCSVYVVFITLGLFTFFLETTLSFSFGKFSSSWPAGLAEESVNQPSLRWPAKIRLGPSDPLSQGFEPWVTWHRLPWGKLTHLRGRAPKSWATTADSHILTSKFPVILWALLKQKCAQKSHGETTEN